MATVVVGDLHGNHEFAQQVLDLDMPVVFIGDYLDSYVRTNKDQFRTLELVLNAAEDTGGQVTALLGNHEMSYLDPAMRCSGHSSKKQYKVNTVYSGRMRRLLKPYTITEGFLISHAGVSQYLLDSLEKTLAEYLEEEDFNQIGFSRGGHAPIGGLYWCDWRDEFAPVEGVKQIVGHTRGRTIRTKGDNLCIDVLESGTQEVVVIEDGKWVDTIKLESPL